MDAFFYLPKANRKPTHFSELVVDFSVMVLLRHFYKTCAIRFCEERQWLGHSKLTGFVLEELNNVEFDYEEKHLRDT